MTNGLMTNAELIDSIMLDVNKSVKFLVGGNYVSWCDCVSSIVARLANLKKGIIADIDSKNVVIEQLKEQLKRCGNPVVTMKPEELAAAINGKDGAKDGNNNP